MDERGCAKRKWWSEKFGVAMIHQLPPPSCVRAWYIHKLTHMYARTQIAYVCLYRDSCEWGLLYFLSGQGKEEVIIFSSVKRPLQITLSVHPFYQLTCTWFEGLFVHLDIWLTSLKVDLFLVLRGMISFFVENVLWRIHKISRGVHMLDYYVSIFSL